MSQDISQFVPPHCDVLAFGEPPYGKTAVPPTRNEVFAQLVERGFGSIALETDRVAALVVNDFVHDGVGTLDAATSEGFSHGFGALDANRQLVGWMRAYNQDRPPEERLTFHGFDPPTETESAPSPRRYLEAARDYLGADVDIASVAGDDRRWSRTEAVMDPAQSPGATPEAEELRRIGDDLLAELERRASSDDAWLRARIQLTAGLGLLRYHKQCAQSLDRSTRISRLMGVRAGLMAQNLLDLRGVEAARGPTMVCAHDVHLQQDPSTAAFGGAAVSWIGAGAIVAALWGDSYVFLPFGHVTA